MTSIIYERGAAREAIIWPSFQYNGPFNALQETDRTTMFGIYANTYLHGYNYLLEIETEDLARLVDTYDAAIARITQRWTLMSTSSLKNELDRACGSLNP